MAEKKRLRKRILEAMRSVFRGRFRSMKATKRTYESREDIRAREDIEETMKIYEIENVWRVEDTFTVPPEDIEFYYSTTDVTSPLASIIHDTLSSIYSATKRKEKHEKESHIETEVKESYERSWEAYEIIEKSIYDDIDDVLVNTLTEDELDALWSVIFDSMSKGRTKIPLEWLEMDKRPVVEAWLSLKWLRYRGYLWFGVIATRSLIDAFSKMFSNIKFRVYAMIQWSRPDAPDPYKQKTDKDRIVVTAYVDDLLGSELTNLYDPSFVEAFLQRAPSYASWCDYLDTARVDFVLKRW